jgi:hypothetical protein
MATLCWWCCDKSTIVALEAIEGLAGTCVRVALLCAMADPTSLLCVKHVAFIDAAAVACVRIYAIL